MTMKCAGIDAITGRVGSCLVRLCDRGRRGRKRCERRPDLHELRQMQEAAQGLVRLVTLSPEWPEAPRFIEGAVRDGIVVSIGHTKANTAQIAEAVSAGATMATHLGNGADRGPPGFFGAAALRGAPRARWPV